MSYKLIVASAHDTGLPSKSVHVIVTSSPYYSLRAYSGNQAIEWPEVNYAPIAGMPEITIKGCDPACDHEWVDGKTIQVGRNDNGNNIQGAGGHYPNGGPKKVQTTQGAYCIHCGGWRGGLGSEGTIESFIGHLILVLREMWRVLRDDGSMFFNLSDSYSGSGGAHTFDHASPGLSKSAYRNGAQRSQAGKLRPKNLMGVPQRFFLAAQAEGWIMRQAMPWLKRNQMPDSTTDRPGGVVESIFLMTKNERYFYDPVAVEQPNAGVQTGKAATFKRTDSKRGVPIVPGQGYGTHREDREDKDLCASGTRNFRSSDLFFRTWEGMLLDDCGDPMAMVINPKSYSGAHFAAFAPEIPETCILAGTSEAGVCPHCGQQWRRCVEEVRSPKDRQAGKGWLSAPSFRADGDVASRGLGRDYTLQGITTGWSPSCSCPAHAPIPSTVADFFSGSGTTGMVCQWLGRDYVGVDLSDEYHALAHERINTPRERVEDRRAPADGQMGLFEEIEL